jgi:hypothetical protein
MLLPRLTSRRALDQRLSALPTGRCPLEIRRKSVYNKKEKIFLPGV